MNGSHRFQFRRCLIQFQVHSNKSHQKESKFCKCRLKWPAELLHKRHSRQFPVLTRPTPSHRMETAERSATGMPQNRNIPDQRTQKKLRIHRKHPQDERDVEEPRESRVDSRNRGRWTQLAVLSSGTIRIAPISGGWPLHGHNRRTLVD